MNIEKVLAYLEYRHVISMLVLILLVNVFPGTVGLAGKGNKKQRGSQDTWS